MLTLELHWHCLILPDGSSITDSVANLTIQPGGSAVIESESLTTSINVGWAEVRASGFLGGYAIFRQRVAGMLDSEGTTQLETVASSSIVFAYDNAAGFQTGVALANLSADAATITAILRGEDGFFLGSVRFDMPGLGHSSFFLSSQFAATANRRGIIEFQNSSGDITGIGLRFSPSLSFTSVPSVR